MAPSGIEWILIAAVGVLALAVLILAAMVIASRRKLAALAADRPVGAGDLANLRADVAQALRHIAVVRYDAFGDMGGRLSFSTAIIDDTGDGIVISSIHARGESRTYAKGIVAGRSDSTLTPEEQQALAAARTGSRQA